MAYTILSPSKTYTGVATFGGGPVAFVNGEARVDSLHPGIRAYMESRGYTVEEHSEGPFTPSERGVREVLAHLKQADEDERERVLTAEREGKARRTILDQYEQAGGDGDGDGPPHADD